MGKTKKPAYYVKTIIDFESKDIASVGKDTRTDENTTIYFDLESNVEIISDTQQKWFDKLQKHLEEHKIHISTSNHGYGPAEKAYKSKKIFFDLNLTRYVNHILDYGSNSIISSIPPIENYHQDYSRNKIITEMDNDIKSLKLLVFIIFNNINDLKSVDFKFLDLVDILMTFKQGYYLNQSEHLFYSKVICSINFSKIYDENKSLLDSYLFSKVSEDVIINAANDYYINCYSKIQLFNMNALYFAFKKYYE